MQSINCNHPSFQCMLSSASNQQIQSPSNLPTTTSLLPKCSTSFSSRFPVTLTTSGSLFSLKINHLIIQRLNDRQLSELESKITRAPSDCVQYFTGTTGSVANYGFGSGDLLLNQQYSNCIRTEVYHHPYILPHFLSQSF